MGDFAFPILVYYINFHPPLLLGDHTVVNGGGIIYEPNLQMDYITFFDHTDSTIILNGQIKFKSPTQINPPKSTSILPYFPISDDCSLFLVIFLYFWRFFSIFGDFFLIFDDFFTIFGGCGWILIGLGQILGVIVRFSAVLCNQFLCVFFPEVCFFRLSRYVEVDSSVSQSKCVLGEVRSGSIGVAAIEEIGEKKLDIKQWTSSDIRRIALVVEASSNNNT